MSHLSAFDKIQTQNYFGVIRAVVGLLVEVEGLDQHVRVGQRLEIEGEKIIPAEVVGFRGQTTLVMPYTSTDGLGPGCRVSTTHKELALYPSQAWLGRILNGLGEPIDDGPPLPHDSERYPLHNSPPPAHKRQRVGSRVDVGIRVLNTFTTLCKGQRMGIFAGSGVGKSVLLSQLAKFTDCDVAVIGLIGERGREVQEFIQDNLGDALERSVVVVATSDESALLRKQAAYTAVSVAEYFRDQGKNVLLLMDSVTRFAMAQREIGLSVGEPPTTKGYPPTVFAELPRLLERSGPGVATGTITGVFTVLVDGDDHNEPVADATRAILDGHIVLDRHIGEKGRYPAVDVLRSVSRTMPDCNQEDETAIINKAKAALSTYEDMEEMIRLGAYRKGSDADVDLAIQLYGPLTDFLKQGKNERGEIINGFQDLAKILNMPPPQYSEVIA